MISQETKDQIDDEADEFRSDFEFYSSRAEMRAYTKGAIKYAEKVEEKNEIIKSQDLELAQLKGIVEKMNKTLKGLGGIEAWINDRDMKEHFQKTVYPTITAYAEWCKQNLK